MRAVLSVSSLVTGYYGINDLCLSLPTIVSGRGIEKVLNLELSETEQSQLKHSAEVLKNNFASLEV